MYENWFFLKDRFLDLRKGHQDSSSYSFDELSALHEMARHDVYPDGRFSDQECVLWSMLHHN